MCITSHTMTFYRHHHRHCTDEKTKTQGSTVSRVLNPKSVWKQIKTSLSKMVIAFPWLKSPAAKSLQSCPTLCDPIDGSPPGSPHPWDSPGKNNGVSCQFLLQCMRVKSESEVAQSCLTLCDPTNRSLPGSCVHGIFQARVLEWDAIAFSTEYTSDS